MNATILKGVHIGNNVIVGACSLINKNIPDNCVAAGNPCRIIMPLDDYYARRKKAQECEAVELVQKYIDAYGKDPNESDLHEFYWLFNTNSNELVKAFSRMQKLGNSERLSNKKLIENTPRFSSLQELIIYSEKNMKDSINDT